MSVSFHIGCLPNPPFKNACAWGDWPRRPSRCSWQPVSPIPSLAIPLCSPTAGRGYRNSDGLVGGAKAQSELKGYASVAAGTLFSTGPREYFDDQLHEDLSRMKSAYDDNDAVLRAALVNAFALPKQGLNKAIEIVRECYNPFGYSDDNLLQDAVDGMAAEMSLASRASGELYDFKCIKSYH